LVLWLGTDEKIEGLKTRENLQASDLEKKLEESLPVELVDKIDIVVLDLASCWRHESLQPRLKGGLGEVRGILGQLDRPVWAEHDADTVLVRREIDAAMQFDVRSLSANGQHLDGPATSKELPLHMAIYVARPSACAVVHLYTPYATVWSIVAGHDVSDCLTALTPYAVVGLITCTGCKMR